MAKCEHCGRKHKKKLTRLDFESEEAYKKWLAYGHIHGVFHGKKKITIRGKPHKVQH